MATLEWLLAAVLTYMRAQDRRGGECLDAVRALVRANTAVHSQVLVKTG